MRILRVVTAIFISCFLHVGAGPYSVHWISEAVAQEAQDAAGAPGSDAGNAPEAGGEPQHVIPPEQEGLLADMLGLGAKLAGCELRSGQVEHKVVNVVYACPGGEVAVQLVHPSQAPTGATQTERFAITPQSGTPPEGLLPALASRIRAKETAFEWKLIGESVGEPASVAVSWVRLGVVSLLGIGIVWLLLRRRASGKKARP